MRLKLARSVLWNYNCAIIIPKPEVVPKGGHYFFFRIHLRQLIKRGGVGIPASSPTVSVFRGLFMLNIHLFDAKHDEISNNAIFVARGIHSSPPKFTQDFMSLLTSLLGNTMYTTCRPNRVFTELLSGLPFFRAFPDNWITSAHFHIYSFPMSASANKFRFFCTSALGTITNSFPYSLIEGARTDYKIGKKNKANGKRIGYSPVRFAQFEPRFLFKFWMWLNVIKLWSIFFYCSFYGLT